MEACVAQALSICPEPVRSAVSRECEKPNVMLEELRLRVGAPVSVCSEGKEWAVSSEGRLLYADAEMLRETVLRATDRSLYAAQAQLQEGYCTLPGGHRLGICGSIVRQARGGPILSVKEFSSLNLRIARQIRGVADALSRQVWQYPESTLIVSRPGCGKTTLLRDLIRQLSDRYRFRVGVLDERGEIAACLDGKPQFQIGNCTDVLSACPKEEGIYMLLRTMRPDWIALDEISAQQDVDSICRASYSGVRFLATAHIWSREDLQQRPVYRRMLDAGIFRNLAVLDEKRALHCERLCA